MNVMINPHLLTSKEASASRSLFSFGDYWKKKWLDYSCRLASTVVAAATGFALGGSKGALLGACTAVVDEALIALGVSQKHYLSSTFFWTASVVAPIGALASKHYRPASSTLELSTYLAGGLGLSYLFNDFFNLEIHIRSPLRSIAQANSLFQLPDIKKKDQLQTNSSSFFKVFSFVQDFLKNPFLTSVTKKMTLGMASILTDYLFLRFLASHDLQSYGVQLLKDPSFSQFKDFDYLDSKQWSQASSLFSPIAYDALKILGALVLKNQMLWGLRKYRKKLGDQQHSLVMDKLTQCLLHKGKGAELLAHEEGAELMHHMNNDFSKLMHEGVEKLDDFIGDTANWILSLATLHRAVPGVLFGYLFSTLPLQRSYEGMVEKIKNFSQKISSASKELAEIKEDITKNMGQIELRGGSDYLNEQYDKALKTHNNAEANLAKVKADWDQSTQLHNFYQEAITYISFALSVAMKGMTLSDLGLYKKSVSHVVKRLSENLTVLNTSSELNQAQNRIEKLVTILHATQEEQVQRRKSEDGSIEISHYHLYLKDQELLSIPTLKLFPGKVYSITGHSGCGKSTFLKDLKQGVLGKLKSSGMFTLPDSIMFIDQDVYLPPNRTLFDTICFPTPPSKLRNFETAVRKQAIINLFDELQINRDLSDTTGLKLSDLLDSKDFQLSGGQRKKIALIQAILQKPEVLIMDESFTGLDPTSLLQVKAALKKYLPQTLILSVDHHACEDHNGFYQHNIHFSDGKATLS